MSVRARIRLAWALIVSTVLGWPASYLVPAKYKEDFILGLSWLAITLTAVDILGTQDVRQQHEENSVTPTSPNGPTVPPDEDVDPRDQAADGDPVGDPDLVRDPAELERNPDEPEE